MKLEEKLEILKGKGWTCNFLTGEIFNSYEKISNCISNKGYIQCATTFKGKTINIKGHQFIYFMYHGKIPKIIDHINCVRDDNRIINLREVSFQENAFNKRNVKGFYYDKNKKKYRSAIKVNEKNIFLGYFNNELDAHKAYLQAKKIYHKIN